ncbi:class I SAM-dependent methyltransferase [Ferrovibrio sp.]|uniref:class I SAM-dependent methyltransferase n=1 Tax=Ferrovibrio sp. TaxID=1917215 RepID=UPI003D27E8DF
MQREEYRRMAALEESMWWYRALHAGVLQRIQRLGLVAGSRLLDAGCGTGGFLRYLKLSGLPVLPQGVEYDAEAAAVARDKTGLPVAVGSVNSLAYAEGSFDVVVSNDVLSHAAVDEAVALAEFRRCLVPGGRLLLSLPAYAWMASAHDRHVHNARRYTAGSARAALERAGLQVEAVGYWNSLLFPLMLLHRLTAGQTQQESDVKPFPPLLDRLFFAVTALERALARLGLGLPFGGSVWVQARKP